MNRSAKRILFFCYDNPHPSGGIRTIYELVEHLNRNGFRATVVHSKTGFRPTWFGRDVPIAYQDQGLGLTDADVLVIPEDLPLLKELGQLRSKKIIFCQNHYYAFNDLGPGQTWRGLGVTHVLASSKPISDFLAKIGWPDAPVVHYAIDGALFKPREKRPWITCMPRKRRVEARFMWGVFKMVPGVAEKFLWAELDELPIHQIAEVLGHTSIFVSLCQLEGLGLPPLEAMSCGCVVVGYHGGGGLEYASDENGFWLAEGEPEACVEQIRRVAEMVLAQDPAIGRMIEAGIRTAARYTAARQEEEIVRFMDGVIVED